MPQSHGRSESLTAVRQGSQASALTRVNNKGGLGVPESYIGSRLVQEASLPSPQEDRTLTKIVRAGPKGAAREFRLPQPDATPGTFCVLR